MQRISFRLIIPFMVFGCGGATNIVKSPEQITENYKKAYIIATYNSQYIKSKFVVITPFAYIIPSDDDAVQHDVIGTTADVIKKELENNGIIAEIGKKEHTPVGFDFIVQYYDTWR
jgi:hypothetical protein